MTTHNKYTELGIGVLLSVFWLIFLKLAGNFAEQYQFIDTHANMRLLDLIDQKGWSGAYKAFFEEKTGHRFIPLFWAHRVTLIYILRDSWALYFVYYAIIGGVMNVLFYKAARLLGFTTWASLVFVFFLFVGENSWFNQATIFFRISSGELLAMPFVALGLLALAKSVKQQHVFNKWEVIMVVSIAAATSMKESFILLPPAFVWLKLALYQKEHNTSFWLALKRHLASGAILATVCVSELLIIVLIIGTSKMGYVGVEEGSTAVRTLKLLYSFLLERQIVFLAFVAFLVGTAIYSQNYASVKSVKKVVLKWISSDGYIWVFALLVLLPQTYLYATAGLYERYLFPAILSPAVILLFYIDKVIRGKVNTTIPKVLVVLLLVVNVYWNLRNTYANAKVYGDSGKIGLAYLNEIDPERGAVLVIADPVLDWEWGLSMATYLRLELGESKFKVVPWSIGADEKVFGKKDTSYYKHLTEFFDEELGIYYWDGSSPERFKYIAFVKDEVMTDYLTNQDWYDEDRYRFVEYEDNKLLIDKK